MVAPRVARALAATVLLAGCAGDPAPPATRPGPDTLESADRGGQEFDPATLRVGDRVLGLRVAQANVELALDSTHVGEVRFAGRVRLRGTPRWHPDHPAVNAPCFEVDSAGAASLPRWPLDRRRVWFCFDNADEAARWLGPPRAGRSVAIEIDDYRTVRHPSDVFDTARLVRVIDPAPLTGS